MSGAVRLASFVHALHLPPSPHHLTGPIIAAVAAGVLTRALLLRADSGSVPTHPHGETNYLFLGFVGSILGALAPPALLTANYTAGVFLGLGLSQFHVVRQIERTMLLDIDHSLVVPRGHAYVEAIAVALEMRNYLAIIISVVASTVAVLWGWGPGLAVGVLLALLITVWTTHVPTIERIAAVTALPTRVEGRCAYPQVGGKDGPCLHLPEEAGVDHQSILSLRLRCQEFADFLTLGEHGQRQAILHSLSSRLGVALVQKTGGEGPRSQESSWHGSYEGDENRALVPRTLLSQAQHELYIVFFAERPNTAEAVRAVQKTPLLQTIAHKRKGDEA